MGLNICIWLISNTSIIDCPWLGGHWLMFWSPVGLLLQCRSQLVHNLGPLNLLMHTVVCNCFTAGFHKLDEIGNNANIGIRGFTT